MKFKLNNHEFTVENLTTSEGFNGTINVTFSLYSKSYGTRRRFEYSTIDGTVRADLLDYYGFEIVETAFNQSTMKKAQQIALQNFIRVGQNADYKKRGQAYKAWEKAVEDIEKNSTHDFKDGILSFTSRFTNKPRYVTEFGCDISCECKNAVSYHKALFEIYAEYDRLAQSVQSHVVNFKPRHQVQLEKMAA